MQAAIAGHAPWDRDNPQRLGKALAVATVLVAALLAVIPPLDLREFRPLAALLVRIVRAPPEPAAGQREPVPAADPLAADPFSVPADVPAAPAASSAPAAGQASPGVPAAPPLTAPGMNPGAAGRQAIEDYLAAPDGVVSASPVMAAKQRRLAGQYPPPTHEKPRPIWENTETDLLGRTVLESGDCTKVLDDPNVTRQDQFRMFDQYLVTCTWHERPPRALPWVATIVERHHYLKYPDGIDPAEAATQ